MDIRERLHLAKELSKGKKNLFWRYFFSKELLVFDKPRPIGIQLLLDRLSRGLVAIVTGRPERLRHITLRQLKMLGIPVKQIWRLEMQSDSNTRKSIYFKLETILSIYYEGFPVVEVHDDELEVLMSIRRYLPKTRLYLHSNDQVIELR